MENATPPGAGAHDDLQPGHGPGPGGGFKDLSQLRRSTTNRYVGGVAGGLARHFDVDPVVVRVLLVVLGFFGGASLLAYVALWLLLPEDGSDKDPFGLDDRSRSVAVKVTGVLTGVLALASALGDGVGSNAWWLWASVLVVGVVLYLNERAKHSDRPGYGDPGYPTTPYGQPTPPPYGQAAPPPYGQTAPPPYGQPTQPAGPAGHDPDVDPPTAPFSAVGGEPGAWTPQARAAAEGPTQQFAPQTRAYPTGAQVGGPVAGAAYAPTPPRNPRKRGPVLFGFTLALVALAIGVLRVVEMNGVAVVDSAYPALALAVTTVMLLVGSFWGRAGGLIALALLLALVTGGVTVGERYEEQARLVQPTSVTEAVQPQQFDAGEFRLDLTGVDPAAMNGERVVVKGGVGHLEVVLPEGLAANVRARVGLGGVTVQDRDLGGVNNTVQQFLGAGTGAPEITLDIDLGVGQVVVRTQ